MKRLTSRFVFALTTLAFAVGQLSAQEQKPDADLTAPLYGRIVNDQGNPVTDASLTLRGPKYYKAKTDEEGRYAFMDVAVAGEYRLKIESKQAVGLTSYRKLPRLVVDPDDSTIKDFTLERACQVKVTCVDEKGKPVFATIYPKSIAAEVFSNVQGYSANRKGVAIVGGLRKSDAKYIFGARSSKHAFEHVILKVDDPTKVVEHKFVFRSGKTVKGKVVCSDGLPPAGWRILALPSWWDFGTYPRGELIAEDGSFELKHIGDEEYKVTVSIPLGGGMSTSRPVLGGFLAKMKQPLDAKLDYPSPKSLSYLNVQVRWLGKQPTGGIHISGYERDLKHHASFYLKKGERTAKIGPMPPGTYRIRPESAEIEVMNLRKIKNLDDLDYVKVPNEKPLQIVLRVRGKPHVQGRVIDAESKEPITSFQFRVTKLTTLEGPNYVQDSAWKIAKSDRGEFETEVVGPGIYVVSVLADGYALQSSQQVNTNESPDQILSVEMSAGVTVRGKVVDKDGRPINHAKVRVRSLAAGAMPRVSQRFVTGQGAVETRGGEFELHNLATGLDVIRVDHPDFAFRETSVRVSEKTQPLTITLTKGATIRGTIFDPSGKPLPNESLYFRDSYAYGGGGDEEAGTLGVATSDMKGRYVVRHLPEQTVYISRKDEWHGSACNHGERRPSP